MIGRANPGSSAALQYNLLWLVILLTSSLSSLPPVLATTLEVDGDEDKTKHYHGYHNEEELENQEDDDEEEHEDPILLYTSIVTIVGLLILLTIGFEQAKDHIHESVGSNLRPIIESLFGEMTVLGFLSVVTFVITKLGYFQQLSKYMFGEEERDELLETFESVHFMLFFIMIFFGISVLLLVNAARETEDKWWKFDRACRYTSYMDHARGMAHYNNNENKDSLVNHCFSKLFLVPSFFKCAKNNKGKQQHDPKDVSNFVSELVLFDAVRTEFILERSMDEPYLPASKEYRVEDDFNFGRYLNICLGHTLAHSVHLDNITWLVFGLITIIFYILIVLVKSEYMFAWVLAGTGWCSLLFGIYFDYHILNICQAFVVEKKHPSSTNTSVSTNESDNDDYFDDPEASLRSSWNNETDPLLSNNSSGDGSDTSPPSSSDLPKWCHVNMTKYMEETRSWFANTFYKVEHPTPLDTFYWMERKGPKLYMIIFQVQLLFCAAYCSLLFVLFLPYMWNHHSDMTIKGIVSFIGYGLVAVTPIALRLAHTGVSTGNISMVSCVGIHRRPAAVAQVIREEKTDRLVRALVILQKLEHAVEVGFSEQPIDEEHLFRVDPVEAAELSKTFDAFDKKRLGYLETNEFEDIMHQLGAPMSSETLQSMIRMLDVDGGGTICKKEFLFFYTHHILSSDDEEEEGDHSVEHHRRMKDRAHYMFQLFDKDGDGTITVGEFKSVFDAFHIGFSIDEVCELVHELDEDDSGTLGEKEFKEFLEKHSYLFQKCRLPSLGNKRFSVQSSFRRRNRL